MDKSRIKLLKAFQAKIKYRFKNRQLLNIALTHKSFAYEQRRHRPEWNERLEFLGDAVLGLVVSEYLYQKFPKMQEGQLSKIKSHLVCTENLQKRALQLQIGEYLSLGKGEERSGGREQSSNLCGVLEALIGAIYIDRDIRAAKKYILHLLKDDLSDISEGKRTISDYKSPLQEYSLKKFGRIPQYEVISQQGPEHRKEFVVTVTINGQVYGRGWGYTKKMAEQMSAKEALEFFR